MARSRQSAASWPSTTKTQTSSTSTARRQPQGEVSEHILFQFIVSGMNRKINMDGKSWTGWLADASAAFLQGSQPDTKRQGPIYLCPRMIHSYAGLPCTKSEATSTDFQMHPTCAASKSSKGYHQPTTPACVAPLHPLRCCRPREKAGNSTSSYSRVRVVKTCRCGFFFLLCPCLLWQRSVLPDAFSGPRKNHLYKPCSQMRCLGSEMHP